MSLPENFPISPHQILHPDIRWFPADSSLNSIKHKLLPPLVTNLRNLVKKFRDSNYSDASETSRNLLNWWFNETHYINSDNEFSSTFEYYFAQREAIETLIYLYDVEKITTQEELIKFDSSGLLVPAMFSQDWRRYVIKLATGAGKTKVLSLAIVWSYFHKLYEKNSGMSNNFLLIAPNVIVLERLMSDFEGGKIFYEDPLIPKNNYEGQAWENDFYLDIHIQKNIMINQKTNNLFLTNIQQLYDKSSSKEKESDDLSSQFIGNRPKSEYKSESIIDEIYDLENLVVLNDEAHHIHNEKLAWFKTIEKLDLNLKQRSHSLSMQIDVTATPKHQDGSIFAEVICDYPLVEAIKQKVVKLPVLPDLASQSKLKEKSSSKYSQQYEDFLRLGVEEWRKSNLEHSKTGKKAVLFIMTDDTKNCDDVANWLEENYPEDLDGRVLTIHTNKDGELAETNTKRGRAELEELRKQSRIVDSASSKYKAIVSVLMLKEGWDVKNVTTIVGLRPYSAKANILPEQALGRGLRKMYTNTDEITEYVSVVGTKNFMEFVDSIKTEGVVLEYREMGENTDAISPKVVQVDNENTKKDIEKLDIEIPILTPRLRKEYKRITELDLKKFDFKSLKVKSFSKEELMEVKFDDIVDEKEHHRTILTSDTRPDWRYIISFFTKRILKDLRMWSGFDNLYPFVEKFCRDYLFGESVDLEDMNIIKSLSELEARVTIEETFKKEINKLTIHETGDTEIKDTISLRKTKPFVIKESEYYPVKKSVFNIISGDSRFELEFAAFLDSCVDVVSFGKNYNNFVNLKLDYVNADGNISYYLPDFLVKLESKSGIETCVVVETKGREDLDVPLKMKRLKQWCEDVNKLPDNKQIWKFSYVTQLEFDKNKDNLKTFYDIQTLFKEYQ